jgi:hypothetical protein
MFFSTRQSNQWCACLAVHADVLAILNWRVLQGRPSSTCVTREPVVIPLEWPRFMALSAENPTLLTGFFGQNIIWMCLSGLSARRTPHDLYPEMVDCSDGRTVRIPHEVKRNQRFADALLQIAKRWKKISLV